MKIKLMNIAEKEVLSVNGSLRYFQGSNRDSLEFIFSKQDMGALDVAFSKENCKQIKIIAEVEVFDSETQEMKMVEQETIYNDYCLRVSMGLAPVVVTPATSDAMEVTEERITIVMAQQTYMEKLIEQLLNQ